MEIAAGLKPVRFSQHEHSGSRNQKRACRKSFSNSSEPDWGVDVYQANKVIVDENWVSPIRHR